MTKREAAAAAVEKLTEGHGIPTDLYLALLAIAAAIQSCPEGPEPDPEIARLPRKE